MRALRRTFLVTGLVALVGALARLRGRGGSPPRGTGWRELDLPEG